jgi:hypothetical protein
VNFLKIYRIFGVFCGLFDFLWNCQKKKYVPAPCPGPVYSLTHSSQLVRVLSAGVQYGLGRNFLVFDCSNSDRPTHAHPWPVTRLYLWPGENLDRTDPSSSLQSMPIDDYNNYISVFSAAWHMGNICCLSIYGIL